MNSPVLEGVDSTTIHAGESATPVYLNYVASATTYANLEAVKAATANGKIIARSQWRTGRRSW